jgi:hypothetical protein
MFAARLRQANSVRLPMCLSRDNSNVRSFSPWSAVHIKFATNILLVLTDCFFSDALQIRRVPHSHNISLSLRLLDTRDSSSDLVTQSILGASGICWGP